MESQKTTREEDEEVSATKVFGERARDWAERGVEVLVVVRATYLASPE